MRKRKWNQRAIVCLAAAASALALGRAPALQAQDSDESRQHAKELFEHGVADYEAGRYEQALGSFQEAFRIRPHPLVNVNIANCYDKLGKPLQALFHFQRFLDANVGTTEQREEVHKAIERLKQQVGKLLLRITPDGALAVIDHGEQRRAPIMDAVALEAGGHHLEVRLAGYRTVERSLEIKGGTTLELSIALEPDKAQTVGLTPLPEAGTPSGATPAEASPQEPATASAQQSASPLAPESASPAPAGDAALVDHHTHLPTSVWIAGGATLGLAAIATITGVLALHADSDFEHAKTLRFAPNATSTDRVAAYNDGRDAADRANALALTTDILFGGALIGAAATVYLLATAQRGEASSASQTARIGVMAGGRGAALQLRF